MNLFSYRDQSEDESNNELFLFSFYKVASIQGCISYFIMSVYVVNPGMFQKIVHINWYPYLYANMIYGYTFFLFSRVTFISMSFYSRIIWSILGSLMFNISSMATFNYIARNWGTYSPEPKLIVANCLNLLYAFIYVQSLNSFFKHIDKKLAYLARRIRFST